MSSQSLAITIADFECNGLISFAGFSSKGTISR